MKEFSKEDYIKNHHDFWMTLYKSGVHRLKKYEACEEFCRERNISKPMNSCFLCEEVEGRRPHIHDCIGNCLGDWEANTCMSKNSLYQRWEDAKTVEERKELAFKIANNCKREITLSAKGKNNIIRFMDKQFQDLEAAKNTFTRAIADCKNIDEAMEAKKDYLITYLEMIPLDPKTCPFCVLNSKKQDGGDFDCDNCLYKEKHGCCLKENSSYSKINVALVEFQNLIADEYWKGVE